MDIHIDEKWYYAFNTGAFLWIPPGIEPPCQYVLSKTHIPKVMFMAAVAVPTKDHGFDGRIGFWPIVEKKTRQNNTKYGKSGETYYSSKTLNSATFKEFLSITLPAAINVSDH